MASSICLAESLLRLSSLVFALLTAILLGFNKETKTFLQEKTMTTKEMHAFWVLMITTSVASAYHFLQLCKCLMLARSSKCRIVRKWVAWLSFAFDQVVMYAVVGTMAAAVQLGVITKTGQEQFQWMKVESMYKRYASQAAAAIAFSFLASGSMALHNLISTQHIFSPYTSNPKTCDGN